MKTVRDVLKVRRSVEISSTIANHNDNKAHQFDPIAIRIISNMIIPIWGIPKSINKMHDPKICRLSQSDGEGGKRVFM